VHFTKTIKGFGPSNRKDYKLIIFIVFIMVDSKKYLTNLYGKMGDLRYDFRNYNLNQMIESKVKGASVLDIGCGNGFLLDLLSKNKEIYGVEPNKDLIKLANEINPKLRIYKGFAEEIDKLITKKVDSILMIDVLEHVEDDILQIKKIHNNLNGGGQFIVVVPAYQFLYGKRDKNNGHYRRYSKKDLINKLSNNGFKIKLVRYWNMLGFFPYLFYEKILKKELNTELRTTKKKGLLKKFINKVLNLWFKYVENNFNFRFGLTIICITEKIDKSPKHY
jgi:SAM-dependent methyltransferase